jgi:hypothetical protein
LMGQAAMGCVLAAPESADDTHLGWPPEPPPTTATASCFPSGHEAGNKTPIISRWVAALWCRMRHRRRKVLTANGWRSSRVRTVVEPDVRPCTYVTYTRKAVDPLTTDTHVGGRQRSREGHLQASVSLPEFGG